MTTAKEERAQRRKGELQRRRDLKTLLILKYGEVCMTCNNRNKDWRGISLSHRIPLSNPVDGKTTEENCLLECLPCHDRYEKRDWLRRKEQGVFEKGVK